MTVAEYISVQPAERQAQMKALHEAILANDSTVEPVIEAMMSKDMILYKERKYMKYGLAGVKNYMSLHCMPIYMNPVLHAKYGALLPKAKIQKGCVNFANSDELPVEIAAALIADCAGISIAEILENRNKKKR
ncbi:MAG TPA: hypothetical protein VIM55_14625 [Mucilaginibacter sp.]